jgi:hypothetical protein
MNDLSNFLENWKKKPTNLNSFRGVSSRYYNMLQEILVSKQTDYGPSNISNAPGGPLNGLRVRIYDKVSRINNLIDTGAEPENESLRDSFYDLANYAVIALMVLDDKWPNPKEWDADGTE